MATAVASKPSAPHQKMKRPPLPAVQTNGVHSHQSSPSPSMSTKRPPSSSGFKQPPPAPVANGVNGNVNGTASRLGNRRRDPQKPGDIRPNRNGKGIDGQKLPKTIPAPYVKTQPYILKKYRSKQPSLIIHLHPTHFRFDQQDGSFSYNSPMKFILEHLKLQTVPHDMIEELQNAGVRFYEGCLIVQVQDHRSPSTSSHSSTSPSTAKNNTNAPFSVHNYSQYLTPSPYVPYPQTLKDLTASHNNAPTAPSAEASVSKDKPTAPRVEASVSKDKPTALSTEASVSKDEQASEGPNVFTVVLFPTPLSLQEEVFLQANTPDLRSNRKQSVQIPRTPASATIPPTPISAIPSTPSANGPPIKKQKMMISGQEIHEFESRALTTTAPPVFLDTVDNIEDAHTVLGCLTDPRHQQSHPAPKTRKRTVAELAADEAIAAQEQAYMLIMDERHNVSGPAAKAGTTDGEAGTATFEPRFETWQAIKNIRVEHKERAEREAEAKAQRDAQAAIQKARMERQVQEHREDAIRRGREAEQQQNLEIQRQNHLKEKQAREAMAQTQRMQENQQRQALVNSQNQMNHGHSVPHGVSQAQHSSPVVRNVTPNVTSSPLVGPVPGNLSSAGQGNASSPARPPSAMQHGHPGPGGVPMAHQRSRQPPSRTATPLTNGTPAMPQATPIIGHATPRINQGSPPMTANPVTNGMPNQGMNGHPQLTPQQMNDLMLRQQHQQRRQAEMNAQYQRMQNGSPNSQMSPDGRHPQQTLHQIAQRNQDQMQYMASLQRQQQAQMQNGNVAHGMPNRGSPAQHLQQPRLPQQNPNQQPQLQQRLGHNPQQAQIIQTIYQKTMQNLAQRHGNVAAITQQESANAKKMAVEKGTNIFKQQQAQQLVMRQQQHQQQQLAHMQAMGQMPPGMNGQMNGMGAHMGGPQISEQQRQAMMQQMGQIPHMGGSGVPGLNGGLHPHMNGGGMGGIQ